MGVAACANLLLHNFTFLPLRFLHACWALLATCFGRRGGRKRLVTDALLYDLMRGITILLAVGLLSLIQISYVYHYIRGEAFIKLYVIFNILDILNKLLCALGQDVLEGLYEATVIALGPTQDKQSNSQEKGILPPFLSLAIHIVAAVAYVWLHSALLFTQIVCFNVAMNSRSAALLTLLISNNFIELKAAVFKRFGAENLFQVACSGRFLVIASAKRAVPVSTVAPPHPQMRWSASSSLCSSHSCCSRSTLLGRTWRTW